MGTRRTERVGNLIQSELAELLARKIKDPRLAMVSITGVDVSPDLKQAKVFFSVLDETRAAEVEQGFKKAAGFLRRELAGRMATKVVPRLVPVYDPSLKEGADMDRLIDKVIKADEDAARAREENS